MLEDVIIGLFENFAGMVAASGMEELRVPQLVYLTEGSIRASKEASDAVDANAAAAKKARERVYAASVPEDDFLLVTQWDQYVYELCQTWFRDALPGTVKGDTRPQRPASEVTLVELPTFVKAHVLPQHADDLKLVKQLHERAVAHFEARLQAAESVEEPLVLRTGVSQKRSKSTV